MREFPLVKKVGVVGQKVVAEGRGSWANVGDFDPIGGMAILVEEGVIAVGRDLRDLKLGERCSAQEEEGRDQLECDDGFGHGSGGQRRTQDDLSPGSEEDARKNFAAAP